MKDAAEDGFAVALSRPGGSKSKWLSGTRTPSTSVPRDKRSFLEDGTPSIIASGGRNYSSNSTSSTTSNYTVNNKDDV